MKILAMNRNRVDDFAARWPCSGLPKLGLTLEFADNGDLTDLRWQDGQDHWDAETSGALRALIDSAKAQLFPAAV